MTETEHRYSRATRRTGSVFACIVEQPIGFAVPLLALLVFLSAPQMPDMFAGLLVGATLDQPWHANLNPLGFGLAAAFLGFSAWYWSRAALMAKERTDDAERRALQRDRREKVTLEPSDWAREWTPRIALVLAALIAASPLIMTVSIPGRTLADAPLVASGIGLGLVAFVFVITWRRVPLGLAGGLRALPLMWRTRTTGTLAAAPFGWLFALLLLGLSGTCAWLTANHPGLLEATLQTPAAGLLAMGLIIGPLVLALALLRDVVNAVLFVVALPARAFSRLDYLDEFADVLGFALLPVILYTPLLLVFLQWPELYKLRTTHVALAEDGNRCDLGRADALKEQAEPVSEATAGTLRRPDFREALLAWKAARTEAGWPAGQPMPTIIFAAEGGGSRAAVWLLSTMRMLDRKTDGLVGRQTFAISGVSGGALGAVTYLQALRAYGAEQGGLDWQHAPVEGGLGSLAQADLLSASISTFVVNDTFGRMLGRYWPFPDRGQALEHAFEREWAKGLGLPFEQTTAGLVELQQAAKAPHLFLNGTDAKTGRRVITSTVRFDRRDDLFAGADDLLAILKRDVPAAAAVTNSARFPYISPAGRYFDKCNGKRQILDGGYFENYGARTAGEIAYRIELLAAREPGLKGLVPIVVVVSNDADAYRSREQAEAAGGVTLWRSTISCRPGSGSARWRNVMASGHHEQPDIAAPAPAVETLVPGEPGPDSALDFEGATPLLGFYAAHGAHGQDALHILRRQLCPTGELPRMIHIALPKPVGTAESAPMNWVLNPAARRYLLGETGVFEASFNRRQTETLARTLASFTAKQGTEPGPRSQ